MGTTARVLIVDDNQIQSATRQAILAGHGWEICAAQQGKQALEILSETDASKQSFGVIVTDHLMPVMSGPEFITELRRRGFTVPVIVLSGLPDAEAAYDGLNVIFRLKPFDPDSLIRLVEQLLGECMRRSA